MEHDKLHQVKPGASRSNNSLIMGCSSSATMEHDRSAAVAGTSSTNTEKRFLSPFQFRGLPKAGPRKGGRAPRRKGKSMIATDTPNKKEIEMREGEKKHKKQRKAIAKIKKRKVLQESSSEDEDEISVYSEDEPMSEGDEESDCEMVDSNTFPALKGLPKEGDFVIVEFEVKGKHIYYVAKVLGEKENETEVSFLRRSNKNPNHFHMPNVPDIATVALNDIRMILPKPLFSGNTKRIQCMYQFDINFSTINLR